MYVQLHRDGAQKLEKYLERRGIAYKTAEIPLIKTAPVMSIEFDCLLEEQKQEILEVVRQIQNKMQPKRQRKWDERLHTPAQESGGWWKGENTEEEVQYERDETV